jgi:hypothetical protein
MRAGWDPCRRGPRDLLPGGARHHALGALPPAASKRRGARPLPPTPPAIARVRVCGGVGARCVTQDGGAERYCALQLGNCRCTHNRLESSTWPVRPAQALPAACALAARLADRTMPSDAGHEALAGSAGSVLALLATYPLKVARLCSCAEGASSGGRIRAWDPRPRRASGAALRSAAAEAAPLGGASRARRQPRHGTCSPISHYTSHPN